MARRAHRRDPAAAPLKLVAGERGARTETTHRRDPAAAPLKPLDERTPTSAPDAPHRRDPAAAPLKPTRPAPPSPPAARPHRRDPAAAPLKHVKSNDRLLAIISPPRSRGGSVEA